MDMNMKMTQVLIKPRDLDYNTQQITAKQRRELTIKNIMTIIDIQFDGRMTEFTKWYNKHKPEELTEYSYTAVNSWKVRGVASIDPDYLMWIAQQLGLPSLSIMGFQELGEHTRQQSKPVNDGIYLDASNGEYTSQLTNQFSGTGWYVLNQNNKRIVRQITKRPGGYELSTNMDQEILDNLNDITIIERIESFSV